MSKKSVLHNLVIRLTIRMTWQESQALKRSAIESNLNMSDYIRQFVPELEQNKRVNK